METDNYSVKYSDRLMTAYGGVVLLKNFIEQIGLKKVLSSELLPPQESNRGYKPSQLIEQMIVSIWLGASNYSQLEMTRLDQVIQNIFGWKKVAEHKAITRYFNKFTQAISNTYMRHLYGWLFSNIPKKPVTIELDSTVVTREGKLIEGASVGYNPKYRGRNSHHPLLAFISSYRLVANFWLRPGNTGTSNNLDQFFQETLHHLGDIPVGLVRADSGFWSAEFMDLLRRKNIPYIIAAKLTSRLQNEMVNRCKTWKILAPGIEVSEFEYVSDSFKYPQRIVVVRQNVEKRNATGKTLRLFADDVYAGQWRYSAFSTSLTFENVMIWDLYRGRANCENQIKELKQDFGLNSFVLRDFWASEAGLTTSMFAYNLMSLFRQVVLRMNSQPTLATIQRMYLNIAAIWSESEEGEKPIVRLALRGKRRRRWFDSLWDNSLGLQNS